MKARATSLVTKLGAFFALALLYAPLAAVVVASLQSSRIPGILGEFGVDAYVHLGKNTDLLLSIYHSILVALFSTILSTVLGTLLAVVLWEGNLGRRLEKLALFSIELPIVAPDILFALALTIAFSILRRFSPLFEPSLGRLVLSHVSFQISFVTLVVLARAGRVGRSQLEAAFDLGASHGRALRRVLLPQLLPGIIAAALLAFTLSLDDFLVSFFVSGPTTETLPLLVYGSLRRGITPELHAASSFLVVFSLLIVLSIATLRATSNRFLLGFARTTLVILGISGFSLLALGFRAKVRLGHKTAVTVLVYSDYIDPSLLDDFEEKTGQHVELEIYESQEEMVSKLRVQGTREYDVIVASDTAIDQMIALDLVAPLDGAQLSNSGNIAKEFRNAPYDPKGLHTRPYLWGTTGVLYRGTEITEFSWHEVLDPKRQRGSVVLLDEARTTLSLALSALGKDPSSRTPSDLAEATELLLLAKGSEKTLGFEGSVAGVAKVLARQAWASVAFSGDALSAIARDPTLHFVIPKEGSSLWVDTLTLSAGSRNPRGAHAFIDFVLDAKNGARLANFVRYGSPNAAARPLLTPELAASPVLYPPATVLARLRPLSDLGSAARLYDEAWTLVKSR